MDDAVVTGAMLQLVRLGAVIPGSPDATPLRLAPGIPVQDPIARAVLAELQRYAGNDGLLPGAAMRRLHDLMRPVRASMEDDLARHGVFNRSARIEGAWLLLASLLVGAIALFTVLPAILSMTGVGIFAIVFAAVCVTAVLAWASRRSWTTERGRAALQEWLRDASADERATFDTVVNQDAIMTSTGGPIAPDTVRLARALRGLGAA